MTTLPEERVLKPLDPPPDDVNDWPDLALREVKIFYQGKGRYADLLEASEDVPLCVLGELMPLDDEQEELALIDNPVYTRMKIDNVTNYAFGQNDGGKPVVWAAGKSGWYEITPSDRYLSHYNDTIEAIDLFYFMVDQYQKLPPKRKRLGFQIDPFLTAYQKHTDYRIEDDDEAMETIHKHHSFLLKQMIEEREDIDWSQTHLWKHLAETYTEEVEAAKTRSALLLKARLQDEETSSSEEESSEEQEMDVVTENSNLELESEMTSDESQSPQSKSSSSSSSSSEDEELPNEDDMDEEIDDQTDWTKPIWVMLNVLRKSPAFDIKNAGLDTVASEIQKIPDFRGGHKAAVAVLERLAEPLLRLMNEAKLRKKFNWSTRAIYAELEATLADDIAEDIRTPAPKGNKQKHRMKSVLRPSGAGKTNKRIQRSRNDEDDDAMMQDEPPMNATSLGTRRPRQQGPGRKIRDDSVESAGSRMDSPSRQLNGHFDINALPELPPAPEAQEMLDLVKMEAKKVGRQHQTTHLEALLGQLNGNW